MQRRYRRYFVILEGEDTGFEASRNQLPKGYAKVEISNGKGSMMLHCQNLRSIHENRMRYRWYLVNTAKDDPTIVDIGPMEVDSNGKGEVSWEFNGENVKGTKESMEDFNVLILLAESFDQRKKLTAPLVGYIDKGSPSWRKAVERKLYGIVSPEPMKEEVIMPLKPKKEVIMPQTPKEEAIIPQAPKEEVIIAQQPVQSKENSFNEGPKKDYSFEESNDLMASSLPLKKEEPPVVVEIEEAQSIKEEPTPIFQEAPIMEEEAKAAIKKPLSGESEKKSQKIIKIDEPGQRNDGLYPPEPQEPSYLLNEVNMTKAMQAYVESTLKMFPKITPFEGLEAGYQWWHIYYNYQTLYRSHMPFVAYIDSLRPSNQYYPYQYPSEYHRQIYPYQHYLFGIQYDKQNNVQHYVYGIPGRRLRREQPYGGKTGFTHWHPCKSGSNASEGFGYWLMHIDPRTGKVVNPLKETKPLDVK